MSPLPSSKSSSPPVSSRQNPNPRNSEISNPIRRSFTGDPLKKPSFIANPRSLYPNTPLNSPSDIPRRNSVGGRDSDDKENGKDQVLKPTKVRTPAACSKVSKNFMSPTISASSKITVSPRKKVLSERNEPARTSVSSSDAKSPFRKVSFADYFEVIDAKQGTVLEETVAEPSSDLLQRGVITDPLFSEDLEREDDFDAKLPMSLHNEEPSFMCVNEEPDCVNLDPTFKISPVPPPVPSPCASLAPLDADPLMPPYDPKTNYLSPRPQFLHYRPNPRVELYKGREGVRLEDSFMSESFSDAEITEESNQSEELHESCNASTTEDEDYTSEPILNDTVMAMETVEKGKSRQHFCSKSKFFSLVLVLSIACLAISLKDFPISGTTMLKGQKMWVEIYESANVSEFSKASIDRLVQNFHVCYGISVSLISELIYYFRGVERIDHLRYCNLTVVPVSGYSLFDSSDIRIWNPPKIDPLEVDIREKRGLQVDETDKVVGDASEESESAYAEKLEEDMANEREEKGTEVLGKDEDIGDSVRECESENEELQEESKEVTDRVERDSEEVGGPKPEEVVNDRDERGSEELGSQEPEEVNDRTETGSEEPGEVNEYEKWGSSEGLGAIETEEQVVTLIDADGSELAPAAVVQTAEVTETGLEEEDTLQKMYLALDVYEQGSTDLEEDQLDMENAGTQPEVSEAGESIASGEDKTNSVNISEHKLKFLLVVLPLIAAAVFKHARGKSASSNGSDSSVKKLNVSKTMEAPFMPAPSEHTFLDSPSQNWPGESCPSEMSNCQESSSYNNNSPRELKGRNNEAQSQEKKKLKRVINKRESLASSSSEYSMGSASYGSFTIYEQIPSKHGHGDEKTITPVRRSSRIRNLATSP